jgi:hypothetical protein
MSNVGGAVAGTIIPLLLIEVFGFRGTLLIAVTCNWLIAGLAMALSQNARKLASVGSVEPTGIAVPVGGEVRILGLLFLTGLNSMGMEVVWIRRYTPYVGTVVYAFASVLATYLVATFIGSGIYQRWRSWHAHEGSMVWIIGRYEWWAFFTSASRSDCLFFLALPIDLGCTGDRNVGLWKGGLSGAEQPVFALLSTPHKECANGMHAHLAFAHPIVHAVGPRCQLAAERLRHRGFGGP